MSKMDPWSKWDSTMEYVRFRKGAFPQQVKGTYLQRYNGRHYITDSYLPPCACRYNDKVTRKLMVCEHTNVYATPVYELVNQDQRIGLGKKLSVAESSYQARYLGFSLSLGDKNWASLPKEVLYNLFLLYDHPMTLISNGISRDTTTGEAAYPNLVRKEKMDQNGTIVQGVYQYKATTDCQGEEDGYKVLTESLWDFSTADGLDDVGLYRRTDVFVLLYYQPPVATRSFTVLASFPTTYYKASRFAANENTEEPTTLAYILNKLQLEWEEWEEFDRSEEPILRVGEIMHSPLQGFSEIMFHGISYANHHCSMYCTNGH